MPPQGSDRLTLSVSQLNGYVRTLFQADALLRSLCVRGEISGFKRHVSGHLYFSLKDEGGLVRCVMFRQNAVRLPFVPKDGMRVRLSGYVSLYEAQGQYQFYGESMERDGVGELWMRFERDRARFAQEGLFDPDRKRHLPKAPSRIGVATSPSGAVIRDIVRVAHRRNPAVDILLCPCRVQGEGAADSIAQAIEALGKESVDAIIVGRGGGSMEDLWAFNEERVVRAVCACPVPIVSAVGHETDFTLCDFAADVRAATPSHAAELLVPDVRDALQRLDDLHERLRARTLRALAEREGALERISARVRPRQALADLSARGTALEALLQRISQGARAGLAAREADFGRAEARLRALDPEAVLRRGYAAVRKGQEPVTHIGQVQPGDALALRLYGGSLTAQALAVFPDDDKGEKDR
ncbi:MAG: exodeoxyribonuclease VII large subunit [Candidatus Spyradocola sp.]|jgi:exodeoxyribonuclease VII large subunit